MSRAVRSVCAIVCASVILLLPRVGFANDIQGWYIGLGAGYDHASSFHESPANVDLSQVDTALVVGSFGYKFKNRLRLELEVGSDKHDVQAPFIGNTRLTTGMVNGMFDIPITPITGPWGVSVGGGLGVGSFNFCTGVAGFPCTGATETHFVGQIIGEINYQVTPNVSVFLQGRERLIGESSRISGTNEQAVLGGLLIFITPQVVLPP